MRAVDFSMTESFVAFFLCFRFSTPYKGSPSRLDTHLRGAPGKHLDLRHCFHHGPRLRYYVFHLVQRFTQREQHRDGKHRGAADLSLLFKNIL